MPKPLFRISWCYRRVFNGENGSAKLSTHFKTVVLVDLPVKEMKPSFSHYERTLLTNWLMCRPWTGRDEPWPFLTADVITFDQNWHHLIWTSAGGKDISSDAQIRVICRMELEMCTKMLKKLSEKLRAKFPTAAPGCSMTMTLS